MSNYSVSRQALVWVAIIQCLLFVFAQTGFEQMNHNLINGLKNHGMVLYEAQLNALQLRRYEKDYFLAINNPVERPRYLQLWHDYRVFLDTNLQTFQAARGVSLAEQQKIMQWRELVGAYARDFEETVAYVEREIAETGRVDDIALAYARMSDARKSIRVVLGQAQELTDLEYGTLSRATSRTILWTRSLLVLALLLAMFLAFSLRREPRPESVAVNHTAAA